MKGEKKKRREREFDEGKNARAICAASRGACAWRATRPTREEEAPMEMTRKNGTEGKREEGRERGGGKGKGRREGKGKGRREGKGKEMTQMSKIEGTGEEGRER